MKLSDAIKYLVEFQWSYIAYALPFALIVIIFYFRQRQRIYSNFRGFIFWLKPSFETNGQASPEKITAAIAMVTVVAMCIIFMLSAADAWHKVCVIFMLLIFICVLFRIITPLQLLEASRLKLPDQNVQQNPV